MKIGDFIDTLLLLFGTPRLAPGDDGRRAASATILLPAPAASPAARYAHRPARGQGRRRMPSEGIRRPPRARHAPKAQARPGLLLLRSRDFAGAARDPRDRPGISAVILPLPPPSIRSASVRTSSLQDSARFLLPLHITVAQGSSDISSSMTLTYMLPFLTSVLFLCRYFPLSSFTGRRDALEYGAAHI